VDRTVVQLTRVTPKVSGLATWSETCKWYSSLSLKFSCIAILWVSLVSFAAITLCVASQRGVFIIVVYFVIDSVRKFLDAPSYIQKKKWFLINIFRRYVIFTSESTSLNNLTPWGRFFLEKLILTQLIKKFPTFLCNLMVHYRVHKSTTLVPIPFQRTFQVRASVWHFVTICLFLRRRVVSPSTNHCTGGQHLVGCPRLPINISAPALQYLEAVSSIHNPRKRHAVMTGTHITRLNDLVINKSFFTVVSNFRPVHERARARAHTHTHTRGPFAKLVDSPYYSESDLCGGAVTVSFSKYLPWHAMHFLQRSTPCSKTCCRPFAASFRRIVEQAMLTSWYGWKSPEIAWGEIWTLWRMFYWSSIDPRVPSRTQNSIQRSPHAISGLFQLYQEV
jgi:hypothetical protein